MRKMQHNEAINNRMEIAMDDQTCELLFDEAVGLAFGAFDEPSEDHVECVYVRLRINHAWGLGDAGATTVH